MSLLFKRLRIHQIFGANTDVGKTVLTSALVRASASANQTVYIKPVSTGALELGDDEHVARYAGPFKDRVHTECLYRYPVPVSPHLAAALDEHAGAQSKIPSDETFVRTIANSIRRSANRITGHGHMYIETAGGVHSPTPSGTTQLDSYRPLFLPTILIGDSRLGGISSTISAWESLLMRGFIVDSIIIFRDNYYRNWEYLAPYFAERGIRVSAVDPPPEHLSNEAEDFIEMCKYYEKIIETNSGEDGIHAVQQHLDACHAHRLEELDSMPRRTLDSVWWPFVQHGMVKGEKDVTVIDSAYADYFSVYKQPRNPSSPDFSSSSLEPQFDGSASWWTQTLGHAHPSLTLAAARASGRYGHVIFPQATHLPALKLAERLLEGPGKGWASRAFFSDDGSTGMEIALKMALRAFSVRKGGDLDRTAKKSLGILGLKGSYHGDTIGAMDACEEGVYTCEWHNAKGYWFDPPTVSFQNGEVVISLPSTISSDAELPTNALQAESFTWVYDIPSRLDTPLARVYRHYIHSTLQKLRKSGCPDFGALVLEPLIMGAGGMIFVDPLFQRVMIDVVRGPSTESATDWAGLPVIFDEVFVGLYRTGMQSTGPLLGVYPDISVNAKILTGGLVPLAVTLASYSIFRAFLSDKKADALLHGHSYTAHPIGCEVANETLKIIDTLVSSEAWKAAQKQWYDEAGDRSPVWSFWDPNFVRKLSGLNVVSEVMTLGTVLSIKMKDPDGGYVSQSAQTLLGSIQNASADGDGNSVAPGGAPFGVHFRTLGNVAYLMTSLNTNASVIRSIEGRIWMALSLEDT